jgi:hypothetical protein
LPGPRLDDLLDVRAERGAKLAGQLLGIAGAGIIGNQGARHGEAPQWRESSLALWWAGALTGVKWRGRWRGDRALSCLMGWSWG